MATVMSSLTPDDTPKAKGETRLQVREIKSSPAYTAYQLTERSHIELPSGTVLIGYPGEWVITREATVYAIVSDREFRADYAPANAPKLQISADDQTTLAKILGFGSTNSSLELTRAVEKLARLRIGDVEVNFSPGQWEEIARRAEKRGQPIATYMIGVVDKVLQDLWTSTGI